MHIREWRLKAAQRDPERQATRVARRAHRKSLPRISQEYHKILNENPFENVLKTSQFNADEAAAAVTSEHQAAMYRFLDMPRMAYRPGRKLSAKTHMADSLRMPDERKREAHRILRAANDAPSGKEVFDAYHDHLKTLRHVHEVNPRASYEIRFVELNFIQC